MKLEMDEFLLFNKQLAGMLKIDLPLAESLEHIASRARKGRFKRAVSEVVRDVESGYSFAQALEKHPTTFPRLYRSMVRAGEEAGNLPQILNQLVSYYQEIALLKKRMMAAIAYPALLLFTSIGLILFLVFFIIPTFKGFYSDLGGRLPLPTAAVILAADILRRYSLPILLAVGVFLIFFLLFKKTPVGKGMLDRFKLRIPIIGKLLRDYETSFCSRTIGSLLLAGVPIMETLDLTLETIQNSTFKSAIKRMMDRIAGGGRFGGSAEYMTPFPPFFSWIVGLGEEREDLDEVLIELGDLYQEEVKSKIHLINILIEPILILLIGLFVGTIIIALFMPILILPKAISYL